MAAAMGGYRAATPNAGHGGGARQQLPAVANPSPRAYGYNGGNANNPRPNYHY